MSSHSVTRWVIVVFGACALAVAVIIVPRRNEVEGQAVQTCAVCRMVPVVSPCATKVNVTIVDGNGQQLWPHGAQVAPYGGMLGVDASESYLAIVDGRGTVVAEAELPMDYRDDGGRNRFPPLQIPPYLCP
jgi:hypothetical protein